MKKTLMIIGACVLALTAVAGIVYAVLQFLDKKEETYIYVENEADI